MSEPIPPQPVTTLPDEAPRDRVIRRVELIIARMLRWGVLISLVLLVSGTLISFIRSHRYGNTPEDLHRLIGREGDFPHTFAWLGEGLVHFRGQTLIVLGLVILMATPVLRVAVSIIAYVIERDGIFVLITSIVLALLIVSFLLGGHA